jgi:hypothetical protein
MAYAWPEPPFDIRVGSSAGVRDGMGAFASAITSAARLASSCSYLGALLKLG